MDEGASGAARVGVVHRLLDPRLSGGHNGGSLLAPAAGDGEERLSTNRRDDLVAKHYRYGKWGAESYWIVDRRDHQVLTYRLEDDHFIETGRFTGGQVMLTYGDVKVPVDIDELLA